MSRKSSTIDIDDIRRVFRLLGEVQDLRFDPHAWRQQLVSGLCTIIDARQGMTVQFTDFTPEGKVGVRDLVLGGYPDPHDLAFWDQWGRKGLFREDPQIDITSKCSKPIFTARREDIISDKQWENSPYFVECVEPTNMRATIIAYFRIPNTEEAFGLAMHRTKYLSDFTLKEKKLVDLTIQELYLLFQKGRLADLIPTTKSLTPRQSQVLHYLSQGDSEKQIAARMHLSKHTIHDHIKAIYKFYNVQSRGELFARLIGFGQKRLIKDAEGDR